MRDSDPEVIDGEPKRSLPALPLMVSYAQNMEDVLLRRALAGVEKGFYVDVGAQDPVADSVTKAFYEAGWRGINIEPVPHWFGRLQADRPEDVNLRIAVGSRRGKLRLFEIPETGLSTTVPDIAAMHHEAGYARADEHEVDADTLDAVFSRHAAGTVHFLKIDAEGAEKDVLEGLSLTGTRPWIILVEATRPNSRETTHEEWEHLLTGRGYGFVWFDGLNRYYVADEHEELKPAFGIQPNVFDRFVVHPKAAAGASADRPSRPGRKDGPGNADDVHEELDRLAATVARTDGRLASLTRDVEALREELRGADMWRGIAEEQRLIIETLNSQLGSWERLAPRPGGAGPTPGPEHPEHHVRELETTVAQLRAELHAVRHSTSWRLTAPVRWIKTALLAPGAPAARRSGDFLRDQARRAAARPGLRRIAVAMLGRHPALKKRLTDYLIGAHALPPPSPSPMQSHEPARPDADMSEAQRQTWMAFSRAVSGLDRNPP